jgi:hypothetical protein
VTFVGSNSSGAGDAEAFDGVGTATRLLLLLYLRLGRESDIGVEAWVAGVAGFLTGAGVGGAGEYASRLDSLRSRGGSTRFGGVTPPIVLEMSTSRRGD